MNKVPRVGIGVFIIHNNRVLLGQRKSSHGDRTWCPPGGHLEFNETIETCSIRETAEETGLMITNIRPLTFTNDIFIKENKHYITIFARTDYTGGIPKVLEPEKCIEWKWFGWSELPQPLFLPLENLLKTDFDLFNL